MNARVELKYNHLRFAHMKSKRRQKRRSPKAGSALAERPISAPAGARPGPAGDSAGLHSVPVWDLPTRLSHAAIVVLLFLQIMSGQFALLPAAWHLWVGYVLLVVVLFRLGWGIAGSESARFGPMLASLGHLPAYVPRLFSRRPTYWPGHNPVGSLSSLLLLLLLLISCATGLFIETWGEYRGPLAERVDRSTSVFLNDLHSLVRWPLYILVGVHVLAAIGYWLFKGEDRIRPIFASGRLALNQARVFDFASNRRAMLILAISLVVVGALVLLGPVA